MPELRLRFKHHNFTLYDMLRDIQGNTISERVNDSVKFLGEMLTDFVNGGVSGFKAFTQSGGDVQQMGNILQGQQSSHRINTGESTSEIFKDDVRAQKLASERQMQAQEVDFFGGAEDARAVSQVKQFGAL